MIGEFGEVFLMDWGLAKILERNPEEGRQRVKSVRDETSRMTTRQGEAIGTPGYMAPELALGQLHLVGEQSDVYALGAILYEILTLRRPYAGKDIRTIVQRMLRTAVIPASQRTPGRDIPEHLEQITSRCLERDQTLRYRSVMDLYRELQGYIESSLGPKDAPRPSTKSTSDVFETYWQTRKNVEDVRRSIQEASEQISPWSRLESKREVWQQKLELERLERELDHLFTSVVHQAKRQLSGAGNTRTLINQIGAVLKTELSETASASRLIESERLISDFKRWSNLELGRSRLAVRTDRPCVQIELAKCEEIDGIMTVKDWQSRGTVPGVIDALTPGSYMVRLHEQRLTYTAPVWIPRVGDVVLDVPLSKLNPLPSQFIYILATTASFGGDEQSFWPVSEQIKRLDDFAISRYPVTFGEYLVFLNELAQYDLNQALDRCPRNESTRLLQHSGKIFSFSKASPFKKPWNPD